MEDTGHQLRVGRIRIGKVCGETESDLGGWKRRGGWRQETDWRHIFMGGGEVIIRVERSSEIPTERVHSSPGFVKGLSVTA